MNERIKKLAQESGFVFWGNEAWGPGEGNIDWSCDYDQEFKKFAHLIVLECAEIAGKAEPYRSDDLIKRCFGIEDAKKDC